jgi:putative endonuclease
MHYVYILQSLKDRKFYTGYTNDLQRRIEEHNNQTEFATKNRAPFKLVYYEACLIKEDAVDREKYLKSGRGKKYLKSRIKHFLDNEAGSESLELGYWGVPRSKFFKPTYCR